MISKQHLTNVFGKGKNLEQNIIFYKDSKDRGGPARLNFKFYYYVSCLSWIIR